LNFSKPDFAAKAVDVPTGPFENPSLGIAGPSDSEWLPLLRMAAEAGWPVDTSLAP
jgi:hypothetical protein